MKTESWCCRPQRSHMSVAVVLVVALSPAFSLDALAASKDLDPVSMVTIPAGEFLMGNPEGKGGMMSDPSDLSTWTSLPLIKSK